MVNLKLSGGIGLKGFRLRMSKSVLSPNKFFDKLRSGVSWQGSGKSMAISRVHQCETISEKFWPILFIGVMIYISIMASLIYIKKHEFNPFEEVRDKYLQVNPFEEHIVTAHTTKLQGKGVVVKLNTMCNSLIQQSPEFNYLVFSQNILGNMCARYPSEVKFVAYIKYEKQKIKQEQNKNVVVYQLQKKVAVINWPNKELIAQKTFAKNYTFLMNSRGLDSTVEEKLCSISAEPSDAEVKYWIASLASGEPS